MPHLCKLLANCYTSPINCLETLLISIVIREHPDFPSVADILSLGNVSSLRYICFTLSNQLR